MCLNKRNSGKIIHPKVGIYERRKEWNINNYLKILLVTIG